MNLQTFRLKEKTWRFLQNNMHLNGFDSELQFTEEFKGLGEVAGDGSASFVSRRSTSDLFAPENLVLTNVESEFDFEMISSPAISGGEG